MKKTWEFLFENIDYANNFAILGQINKICLDGIEYDGGEIRHSPVTMGGTSWVPLYPDELTVKEDLKTLVNRVENAKTDTARLNGILDVFSYLCRTQIFIDGNKRVAPLFANKTLMQYDLGILSILVEKCSKFKELLTEFYETPKNFDLKKFLFHQILPRDRNRVFHILEISEDSYSDFENNVLSDSRNSLHVDDDGTNRDDISSR